MKIKKEALILMAALVTPGGFIALGLWKAYELYKKKPKEEKPFLDQLREEAAKEEDQSKPQ